MLRIRALGNAEIQAGTLQITPASPRKFALLLRLAADAGRRVPKPVLLELIFPDFAGKNARHSLRDLLYQLRQAGVNFDVDAEGVLVPRSEVSTDFEDLILAGHPDEEQLASARGGLLPGYAPGHSESFSEWLEALRARITLQLCQTLSRVMARAKAVADWRKSEEAARACLGLDPSHEEATLVLAEMLAIAGSKVKAEQLLDDYANDVGARRPGLQVPAQIVRRRISERIGERYRSENMLQFIGRESEMQALNERFELARMGEAQCAIVAGEAGIGKSRLVEEFCTQALLRGAQLVRTAAQPHDVQRPLAAFAELVPRLLELPGALGCAPESMTSLRRLTSPEPEHRQLRFADADSVSASIYRAIADLIAAVASESTLVLFVDDVQWVDDLSRSILTTLASTRHRRRLFVVMTTRDKGVIARAGRHTERLLPLLLKGLPRAAVDEVISSALDVLQTVEDAELRTWIGDSCGGNPLFLRCLISHYETTGERFAIPATLSSLLDQQLLTLGPDSLSVLSMSVALGRHSSVSHLVAALEIPHINLQRAIRELESCSLLSAAGGRLEPAHWLIAESVNRVVSPIARKLLHRRAAEILEGEASDLQMAGSYWDCAEHWILADEPIRACVSLEACANQSTCIGRPREAAEILLRAATLVGGAAGADFLRKCVEIADSANEPAVVLQAIETAARMSVGIELFDLELIEAHARMLVRDEAQSARDIFRRWLDESLPCRDRKRALTCLLTLAIVDCDPGLAHEAFTSSQTSCTPNSREHEVADLIFLMTYHSRFGDMAVAIGQAERLLQTAHTQPPEVAADIGRKCGMVFLLAGETAACLSSLRSAFDLASSHGLIRMQCLLASVLSDASLAIGDDLAHRYWSSVLDTTSDSVTDGHMYIDTAVARAERACLSDDAPAARRWIDWIRLHCGATPTARITRSLRAFEAWANLIEGRQIDVDVAVNKLISHHQLKSEAGDMADVEIFVAMQLLTRMGRQDEAVTLLDQYILNYRRPRGPLARPLQEIAGSINWEGDETLRPATFGIRGAERSQCSVRLA